MAICYQKDIPKGEGDMAKHFFDAQWQQIHALYSQPVHDCGLVIFSKPCKR